MSSDVSETRGKLPLRRWGRLALRTFLVGYIGVVLFFTICQRQLIYVPSRLSMAEAGQVAAKNGFVAWRNESGRFIGWKSPSSSTPAGSVLIAHGNGGWALNRYYMAPSIHAAAPLDVFILEYPGYGPRDGSPGEQSVLAAGDEAFRNLPKNIPVYLVSESLGAGVVAHLAQKYPAAIAGIALFVPFDKLASVAQNHVPFIPAYFLLWDRYNPAEWLENYRGPIKVIVAGSDEIVPPVLGRRLYEGYKGPKQLEVLSDARHAETADEPAEWWRELLAFWKANTPGNHVATDRP